MDGKQWCVCLCGGGGWGALRGETWGTAEIGGSGGNTGEEGTRPGGNGWMGGGEGAL